MFPLILGLLTFDTPFNGLSRSMFAYGAFNQYQNLSSLYSLGTSVGSLLSAGGSGAAAGQLAAGGVGVAGAGVAGGKTNWKRWQLLASRTGTYGAIIAGGVAAYMHRAEIAESLSKINKESISSSWSKATNQENIMNQLSAVPAYVSRESIGEGFAWLAGHLKFIGALMKPAQLRVRLERLSQLKGMGVVNFYTSLGENGYWSGGYFVPKRTFCAIPEKGEESARSLFREQANPKAKDEIAAHCGMFKPETNPDYEDMGQKARDCVVNWIKSEGTGENVVDEFEASEMQRRRSINEATLWDDDGNVRPESLTKDKTGKKIKVDEKMEDNDEVQLQALLNATNMPEPTDGGVNDEEELKKAAEIPLPLDQFGKEELELLRDEQGNPPKTWRDYIVRRVGQVSMPNLPSMPSMPPMSSMPSMPSIPSIPSIPSMRIPGRKNADGTADKSGDTKEKEDAESASAEKTKVGQGDNSKDEDQNAETRDERPKPAVMEEGSGEQKHSEEDQVLKGWAAPLENEVKQGHENPKTSKSATEVEGEGE